MSELAPPKPAVTEGSTDEGLDVEPGPTPAFPEAPELKLGKEDEVIAQGQFELVLPRVAEATVREAVHGPEPSVMIGGFPWRFMVYPKGNGSNAVGVFLELDAKCDAMPTGEYTIFVSCVLEVVSTVDDRWNKGKHFYHRYHDNGNRVSGCNWGFKNTLPLEELGDSTKGYLADDGSLRVRARVMITDGGDPDNWGIHSTYDSKSKTGMVGIRNLGMTCYMNSVLQTLYHTIAFRQMVYQIPTQDEQNPESSVVLGLQRVFTRLQTKSEAVATEELTKSFGWSSYDSFMQHDVQEFMRVLMEKVEEKMKGTPDDKLLMRIFAGGMRLYIKCVDVEFESSQDDIWYDIQLRVKGMRGLVQAFEDYCDVEMLDGENQYYAKHHGLQDAEKGTVFTRFPPVVQLQLRRAEYDFMRDEINKVNDRFEFPTSINLDQFLAEPDAADPALYSLHSILAQGGDANNGHYVVYIRPDMSTGQWYKFDDETCTKVDEDEAVEGNYGGDEDESGAYSRSSQNAYMLVYVRDNRELLAPSVPEIPAHLVERFKREEVEAARKQKEEQEESNALDNTAHVILIRLDDLKGYSGLELNTSRSIGHTIEVPKATTLNEFYLRVSEELSFPADEMLFYPFEARENKTNRPCTPVAPFLSGEELQRSRHCEQLQPLYRVFESCEAKESQKTYYPVYFQTDPVPAGTPLPRPEDGENPESALMFFKYYDPRRGVMELLTAELVSLDREIGSYSSAMAELAQLPVGTAMSCVEELEGGNYPPIRPLGTTFRQASLQHGDVIVWSADTLTGAEGAVDTTDYLMNLFCTHRIEFRRLEKPDEPGVHIDTDKRWSYDHVVKSLAEKLGLSDHRRIQLTYQTHSRYGLAKGPSDTKVLSTTKVRVHEWRMPTRASKRKDHCLYYAEIDMPIEELEQKHQVMVQWLDTSGPMKKEEHTLLLDSDATVDDLIRTLLSQLDLSQQQADPRQCRLVRVSSLCRIKGAVPRETRVHELTARVHDTWRVEAIPEDQVGLDTDDLALATVFHAERALQRAHGLPFYFTLKANETARGLRERLQAYVKVPDDEFTKWRLGFVLREQDSVSGARYNEVLKHFEDDTVVWDVDGVPPDEQLQIVLDHFDRSPKPANGLTPGGITIN